MNIFLFEFSKLVKQQRQLAASMTHLAQETTNEPSVQQWLKVFPKEDEKLEHEHSGQYKDVTKDQLADH